MDDLDELLGSLQPSAATKDAATNDAGTALFSGLI